MVDKDIKRRCKAVRKSFLTTLEHTPETALFLLGNVCRHRLEAQGEDAKYIEETFQDLKQKIKPHQIQTIWEKIHGFQEDRWKVMDQENKKSVLALKRGMLRDIDFFKEIQPADLIKSARDPHWYREAFIALIRQHLLKQRKTDPFIEKFSYDSLMIGGPENNYPYLCPYIQKCEVLPVNYIGEIAKGQPDIAMFILLDCQNHELFFEISNQFIKEKAVRKQVASAWKSYVDNYTLSKAQEAFLTQRLPEIQTKLNYSEFKDIEIHSRPKKHHVSDTFKYSQFLTPEILDVASISVAAPSVLYLSSYIFTHGAAWTTLAGKIAVGAKWPIIYPLLCNLVYTAPAVVAPLAAICYLGYKAEQMYKSTQQGSNTPERAAVLPRP